MKELLQQLASYNAWASRRITDVILMLPEEKCHQELPGSFPTIFKTILHCWDAESVWWQRVRLQERTVAPSEHFNGKMNDAIQGLLHQSKQWEEWVHQSPERALEHVFQYYNNKKESFKQPVFQVVTHVINHSTYHRGQMITQLHQLGVDKLPATDFIVYTRKK